MQAVGFFIALAAPFPFAQLNTDLHTEYNRKMTPSLSEIPRMFFFDLLNGHDTAPRTPAVSDPDKKHQQ